MAARTALQFYLAMSISWWLAWFKAHSKTEVSNHSRQICHKQHILTLKVPAEEKQKLHSNPDDKQVLIFETLVLVPVIM